MIEINNSQLFVVNNIELKVQELKDNLPLNSTRVISSEKEEYGDFLILQANLALKEAYISSAEKKYILLAGASFRVEAQNALLKLLEEPPKNIIFILITNSKSSILPTVLSRIPHKIFKEKKFRDKIDLNIKMINLQDIYSFIHKNQRISKNEAKEFIENLLLQISSQKIQLTKKQLESFSNSIKLIELNSKPIIVITSLLLTFL